MAMSTSTMDDPFSLELSTASTATSSRGSLVLSKKGTEEETSTIASSVPSEPTPTPTSFNILCAPLPVNVSAPLPSLYDDPTQDSVSTSWNLEGLDVEILHVISTLRTESTPAQSPSPESLFWKWEREEEDIDLSSAIFSSYFEADKPKLDNFLKQEDDLQPMRKE
ncbi:hypothetical protein BT69DRAFT_785001 [Atractiella rhizophila]|nr:hypothetical protein BT69DRAFT_785001 [Atractiella rhizophila]